MEDYLLKPLKQEELTGILLRLSDKLGKEAALEFQLKKSGERQQERLMEDLRTGRRKVRQWTVQSSDEGPQVLIPRNEWEVKSNE